MKNMKIVFISALIVTLEAVVPVWYNATKCGISIYKDPGREEGISSSPETFGIVGGKSARRYEFPWVAGLVNASKLPYIRCGASVISEIWVMTAAHCIEAHIPSWMNQTRVVVGEYNLLENAATNKYRKYHIISRYFIADGYRNNKSGAVNDIALLKLEKKISMSKYVRPVCAPDTEEQYVYWSGVMSGWGALDVTGKTSPAVLKYVRLNISKNSECNARINSTESFSENNMCATDDQWDVKRSHCHGDSGGPLVVRDGKNTFSVVGIASAVWNKCAVGFPGIYTRVGRFANWITNTMKNN